MRIKSLELIGFKSFYEKTAIHFHDGINAIVGPNGCGKSNILDAIRWVLGEQNPRRLRATEMEEVISNGGESLKPLGMAEVSLVIGDVPKDNFDEIIIKRRLFRSGESEYYINGIPCRLKDITEMFMDTGIGARAHSIIGQGKVEHIITAKSDEKRVLIEEVAGIVKYKVRRRETESRIESTKENLRRLRDVINEVNRQMQTLSRQAKDAEEFKRLSEEVKWLQLKILHSKLNDLEKEKIRLLGEKSGVESKLSYLEKEINDKEAVLKELESKVLPLEQKIEDLEKEIYKIKSELQTKESLQELLRNEASSIDEFIEKLEREIESLREEKEKIEVQASLKRRNLEEVRKDLSSKETLLIQREEALSNLEGKSTENRAELEATRTMLFENLDKYSSLKGIALGYEKELTELKSRRERIRKEIEEVESERKKILSRIWETEHVLKDVEGKKSQIEEAKRNTALSLSTLNAEQESKKKENTILSERLNEVCSRLNVLRQIQSNYEWLPEGIRRFFLERKGNGILGVIADFISVPKGYEQAIEAAFGDKLKWALVKESEEALRAVESLRELSIGRGTFIPIDNRRENGEFKKNGKDILPLSEIVKVEGIERHVIENMLKGVFLVSSLREALSLRDEMEEGTSFVTLSGDLLDSTGAISGGFAKEGIFERKREIEELSIETLELEEKLSRISSEIELNQSEIQKLQGLLDELEKDSKEVEIKEAEIKKDIANLRDNLLKTERRYEIIKFELMEVNSEIQEREKKLGETSARIECLRDEKTNLEKRFREIEEKVQKLEEEERELEREITSFRVEIATSREKEKGIKEDLDELENRKKQIIEKIKLEAEEIEKKKEGKLNLIRTDEDTRSEVKSLLRVLEEKEKELSLKENEKNELLSRIKKIEEEKEVLRGEIAGLKEKYTTIELNLNGFQVEIEHIKDAIQKSGIRADQAYSGEASESFSPENLGDFDRTREEARLRGLEEKLEKFGPVNLLAPEEYKELEERYKFLSEQIEDLVSAISSLRKAMNRIDRESEKRFKETFEVVNKKFGETFGKLFRGGEAKLILTNPDDILQTGVEVMVKPRGKRFQSVNLLSGGEKALSAIALVLSACFVKSTPFLLLDEIDASLDDVSTAQFIDLLKDIAKESQVIIITHNKRTMQAVDSLIGITSDKLGVSKVVSVELRGV
jgi:chromosome segregation protein